MQLGEQGLSGSKDERGLVTFSVPYLAENEDELLSIGTGGYFGLAEVGRTWREDKAGTFVVDVTYEGRPDEPSEEQKKQEITYEAKSSFREEPIEAHPKIEELIKKYNGQRDRGTQKVTFPPVLDGTTGTDGLAGEAGSEKETINPMAGVEKFMLMEIVWTVSYIRKEVPDSIFLRVGKITKNPPGDPPRIPKRRGWLVMPPSARKRGNVVEITEEFLLLPESTPFELYDLEIE